MSLVEVLLALAIGVAALSVFLPFWLRHQVYWSREMQYQRDMTVILSCVSELDRNAELRGGSLAHLLGEKVVWEWSRFGNVRDGFVWQLEINSGRSGLHFRRRWEILSD